MIVARFTEQMTDSLKKLKGEKFVSYFIDDDNLLDRSYCVLRIKTGHFCLDIMNEEQEFPFLNSPAGDAEELSCFSCLETSTDTPFHPYVVGIGYKEIAVDENVCKVSLISDQISIQQENYEIILDMALIIQTDKHKYIFARKWYFDEQIYVYIDEDYDKIYSVDEVRKSWSNDGEFFVEVKRMITEL